MPDSSLNDIKRFARRADVPDMRNFLRSSVYPVLFVAVVGGVWLAGQSSSRQSSDLRLEYAPAVSLEERYDPDLSTADVNTSDRFSRADPD